MKTDNSFYAHGINGIKLEEWHSLYDHLRKTADIALKHAQKFDDSNLAYLCGLLHDAGKFSEDFQERLRKKVSGENANRVDHSTAGAQEGFKKYPDLGMLLSYCISGHHVGLPDGQHLENRLNKKIQDYSDFRKDIQLPDITSNPSPLSREAENYQEQGFMVSFYIRMLFSALVDADYLNTESFFSPEKALLRKPGLNLYDLSQKLESYYKNLLPSKTKINCLRQEVLQQCNKKAELERGLFSLTVPTGGGKTLSSLSFALRHANKWGMERIIYVIPYTSIIEQNAQIFKEIFGDESVLEHHSNYDPDETDDLDLKQQKRRLATENWDVPLIVTTNVQFFESLFAAKTSRSRKLHNISKSVIILDEAQMLPPDLLLPCLATLKELTKGYGSSVVFCTATQPALEKRKDFPTGLEGVQEIIENPKQLFKELRRVNIYQLGKLKLIEIANKINQDTQSLCIVNRRQDAQELFKQLNDENIRFHLSTRMCAAHRKKTLKIIRERLSNGLDCQVISTQLIEAGVDIDFPKVYRAMAGVDSIAQAAGRCNREGKLEKLGKVYLFTPPKPPPPGLLRIGSETAEEVLRHEKDPLSQTAVRRYFELLFWKRGSDLDKKNILDRLAMPDNKLLFPFKEVENKFRIIEQETETILIRYNEDCSSKIQKLQKGYLNRDLQRSLQSYSVQVFNHEFKELHDQGIIEELPNGWWLLTDETIYHKCYGLDLEGSKSMSTLIY